MSDERRTARRYHWLSEGLTSFVDAPHSAIDGPNQGTIVNLTDQRAAPARDAQLDLVQLGPERVLRELRALSVSDGSAARDLFAQPMAAREEPLPHLQLPAHHEVRASDVLLRRLHATLAAAADSGPRDFADLLLTPGVGARTVLSLALVAEVVHGAPCRFADPARFAFAHGGKDGHPYPVPLRVYDETLRVLQDAVARAKLGQADKLSAIERLDRQARALDGRTAQTGPSFDAIVREQRERMPDWGGRTVMDDAARRRRPPRQAKAKAPDAQLRLPGLRRTRSKA
jgi:hypothetical protein